MKTLFVYALFMVWTTQGYGQHEGHPDGHSMKGTHRLTLGLAHTHISNGRIAEKTEWLTSPSWSLNYDYWLSNKWAIGLQNDVIIETFLIENAEGEEVERGLPISVVPVAIFKPGEHFSFIGGIGAEFAESGKLTLTRIGVEYGVELPKNWEAGVAFVWDNAWDHYNSWSLAVTFSKLFQKANESKE